MKHIFNLITLVVLCFCMVTTKAQVGDHIVVESEQHLMDAFVGSASLPGGVFMDSLAQTFYKFSDMPIYSVALSVHDAVAIEDRPGTLTIISGNDPYGPVVFEGLIMIPGLNKFVDQEVIEGITTYSQASQLFNSVMTDINTGVYTFDDVKTEYAVNLDIPSGYYTIIISTDGTAMNEYSDGTTHAPWIVGYANCGSEWICGDNTVLDPYQFGYLLQGGGLGIGGSPLTETVDFDMAFEIKVFEELSTGVRPVSQYVRGNIISVPESWNGARVETYDVSGRLLSFQQVRFGDILRFPEDQVLIVRAVLPDGTLQSEQVSTIGF